MRENRVREAWLLLGTLAVSGLIGLLTGWLMPALLTGLLLYTLRHLYLLAILPDMIGKQREWKAGYAAGLWADVFRSLDAREHDSQQREKRLADELQDFRDTVSGIPDAVVILQADSSIGWSNRAAGELLGLPVRAASGQPFTSLVRDPLLSEYMNSGNFLRPLVLSSPVDRTRTLLLHVRVIDSDRPLQVVTARDITGLHHLNESQRDFVANISHELRTPLTVITGLLEQLEEEVAGSGTGSHIIGIMSRQAQRMRDLISDLLTLMRIETETERPVDEPVAVPDMIESILEDARTLCGKSGHVVSSDIQPGFGLLGNASELRAAFTNLVVNAIRHTPARAHIRVRWEADEKSAKFSVSDTGEGIPARHIPRLTERFYRVDSSRSRDTGGTGLGLAIVKQVLDRHDATLEVDSTVGYGSTFSCRFPAARTCILITRKN